MIHKPTSTSPKKQLQTPAKNLQNQIESQPKTTSKQKASKNKNHVLLACPTVVGKQKFTKSNDANKQI